jgi:PE-PPE domain
MRKSARAFGLVIVSVIGAIVLGITSALSAAFAFGAVALIVPGTGTHNINPPNAVTGYKENAADRFINPSGVACTSTDGCGLVGVDYPATFFPLVIFNGWCPGLSCDTWNKSVGTGVANLNSALINQLANPTPDNQQIILFGYSQGGAVVSQEMYNLAGLDQSLKDRITVVTIGNINNPQGLWSRLSFLPTIPGLNISFGPQLPTDIGIKSTNYAFEYDPVGDAPLYWGNPFAMLNALAAFEYVHGYYLVPNSNAPTDGLAYGYNPTTLAAAIADPNNIKTYKDATFILIPQQGTLPIMMPFLALAAATGTTAIVKPIVDLVSPVMKVLIDLGYDRTINPGIPQTLSILPFNPFQNWGTIGTNLVNAAGQGIHDFLADLGVGSTMLAPATVQGPPSLLAGRSPALAHFEETLSNLTKLGSVKKSEASAAVEATQVTATPATAPADTPATKEDQQPATQSGEGQTDDSSETPVLKASARTSATHAAKKDVADVAKNVRDAVNGFKKNAKDAGDASTKGARDAFNKSAKGTAKKAATNTAKKAAA